MPRLIIKWALILWVLVWLLVMIISGPAYAQEPTPEVERRILEWIVERNPKATIRDFSGFPKVLLEESKAAGIDVRLVMAVIDQESRFRPEAVGKSGEVGLMQIHPSTAKLIAQSRGWVYEPRLLAIPSVNVRYGLAYLQDQVAAFGVTPEALRAYNRGPAQARQHRPADRYAEDVALRFLRVLNAIPKVEP